MWPFPVVVPGVGSARYASPMDPTIIPILSAIGGGVIGAAVNQFVTHFRAKADREEAARTIQRDSAGALLAALQNYGWEIHYFRDEHADIPTRRASELELPEDLEKAHRRYQVELNRARMAVVDPECRLVVSELHRVSKHLMTAAPIDGYAVKSYTDWLGKLERMLDDHADRLLDAGERNLRPGGPDRRPLLRWRREAGQAAGGE